VFNNNRWLLFTGELSAQLADARGTTTAKLDAPVNKLARLLNSPSIKRVLLNDSLRVNFDRIIERQEVLVVKGALGAMGAGNTSVLMQLLVGMLDAALARRQDGVAAEQRTAVALKVDEAPLVLNRGFAETMALKRSAGLETVACWQTDSQWTDRDVRAQLDALFAHRVYFATASVDDARRAASLMMVEFSDAVRPGIRNLSELGRPDARLRLPRHSAIASWVTPGGRQAPFIAHTLPLCVDERCLTLHAAQQAERGGRYLEDLSQPHWERGMSQRVALPVRSSHPADRPEDASSPGDPDRSQTCVEMVQADVSGPTPGAASSTPDTTSADSMPQVTAAPSIEVADRAPGAASPSVPVESYRELVNLDSAHGVRWAKPVTPIALDPEPLDIAILELVASMRHVLSSQIHRRFNDGRAATTTQRRLKRLSDAGLVVRLQFHRRDGGGVPMCYSITPAGLRLACEHGGSGVEEILAEGSQQKSPSASASKIPGADDRLLRQVRHEVRAAGWVLAVERALGDGLLELQGPDAVISPPSRGKSGERLGLGPSDLGLEGGRTPHDFLRTVESGVRVEVERFQSIRPDATIGSTGRRDLLVELDDRLPEGLGAAKIERYDHFLSGWGSQTKRYKRAGTELPLVVFVCRDGSRARECARRADHILTACRAYAGEYPSDWHYLGRERIVFAAERDAHEGRLGAWGVPRLPPDVRAAAGTDSLRRDSRIERRDIYTTRSVG
jgi:hypothetical protein